MAPILLFLLIFIQSSGATEIQSRVCGLDRVGYVKSSDGHQVFVNGRRVKEQVLICEALDLYFGIGCLVADEEWGKIGEKYCDGDFSDRPSAISGNFSLL